jgi:NTP pyrophosphatase (non-canonical NTP hydrolase)
MDVSLKNIQLSESREFRIGTDFEPVSFFIDGLIDELVKFRDARHWEQFHNTKDLALAISIEAAELNELFLWKTTKESELVDQNKLKEELADVLAFSLLLAGKHGFDVKEIVLEKIRKNDEKYPVEKAKGTAKKYDEL